MKMKNLTLQPLSSDMEDDHRGAKSSEESFSSSNSSMEIDILKLLERKLGNNEISKIIPQKRGQIRKRLFHLEMLASAASDMSTFLGDEENVAKLCETSEISAMQRKMASKKSQAKQEKDVQEKMHTLWQAGAVAEKLIKLRWQMDRNKMKLEALRSVCTDVAGELYSSLETLKKEFMFVGLNADVSPSLADFALQNWRLGVCGGKVENSIKEWHKVAELFHSLPLHLRSQLEMLACLISP